VSSSSFAIAPGLGATAADPDAVAAEVAVALDDGLCAASLAGVELVRDGADRGAALDAAVAEAPPSQPRAQGKTSTPIVEGLTGCDRIRFRAAGRVVRSRWRGCGTDEGDSWR